MVNNSLMVSVAIPTCNQVSFIEKCLKSVLSQKTSFPIEVILGDDSSTDGTREICIKYSRLFPDKIKLILHSEEDKFFLFGKRLGQNNLKICLDACSGQYIALCEGDDYWTDTSKLQKQVEFLESNLEASGCFHDVINVDKMGNVTSFNYYNSPQDKYSLNDCLINLTSSYATCSLMFRRKVLSDPWPNWLNKRLCDELLDLQITTYGYLYHIPLNMGAYRIHEKGVWQGSSENWKLKEIIYRYELLYYDNVFCKRIRMSAKLYLRYVILRSKLKLKLSNR